MVRSLAFIALVVSGCIMSGYSKPVPSLGKQAETVLAGSKKGYVLGELDGDLRAKSKKSAIAATEGFWIRYRGVNGDAVCFEHQAAMNEGRRDWAGRKGDEWAATLRKTMVVVQVHDTLDAKTVWEKRAKTDVRSVRIVDEKIEKKVQKLKKTDGTPYIHYEGNFLYEVCAALPPSGPSTRYLTIRWAPNSDGQQLFVYAVEPGDAAPAATDTADEDVRPDPIPADGLTLMAALEAAGKYKMFVGLLVDADLDVELDGPGPFTILAPTDEAFAAWPERRREKLFSDKQKLGKFLRTLVLVGSHAPTTDTVKLDARTLGDKTTPVATTPNGIRYRGTELGKPIAASNGLIYRLGEAPAP